MAYVTHKDLEMISFDVCAAFLYGELQENILMEVPEGVEITSETEDSVCVLRKSLYGLKQAPRCWNVKFKKFLQKFSFSECEADGCIFSGEFEGHQVFLALFVDDGLLACKSSDILNKILTELNNEFAITVGDASYFVGLQIARDRCKKSMFINQSVYIEHILSKFGMSAAKSMSMPADPNVHLHAADPDSMSACDAPYREAIGSLMFLTVVSRPDIAYIVNVLSKYLNNFDSTHWHAVKRVFAYLRGTSDVGIVYHRDSKENRCELVGYSDADFASDIDTRRSTTGYIFCLNESPVTWNSQRQKLVTVSTTEAEYVAASTAAKELCWLKKLVNDIGCQCDETIKLLVDNQSAIKLAKNPQYHKRTKHIDIRYHFIREKVESGELTLEYVPSESQKADILTKALPRDKHLRFCESLNLATGIGCV